MTWSPPTEDFVEAPATQPGELTPPYRVSAATQAARDNASLALRATYESGGDPTGLGDVEARIKKVAGGKPKAAWSPPTGDFQQASWQPPAVDSAPPKETPSFLSAFGQDPKDAVLDPEIAKLMGAEGIDRFMNDNVIKTAIQWTQTMGKLSDARKGLETPDENGVTPMEREIQRRKDAGESTDVRDIFKWADTKARESIFGPAKPKVSVMDQLKETYHAAVNDPAKFAGDLFEGAIHHPEYFIPIVGQALIPVELAMEQKVKSGEVDAKQLAVESATAFAPVIAVKMALHVANARAAKVSEKPIDPAVEERAYAAVQERVSEGVSADKALDDVLKHMEIAPEERAALVKGVDDAVSKRVEQKDGEPQHQGTDVERPQAEAGGSDRVEPSAQGQEAGSRVGASDQSIAVKQWPKDSGVGKGQGGIDEPKRIDLTTDKGVDVVMQRQGFGMYKLFTPDGESIGGIDYARYPDGQWKPHISVEPEFQRKGVATAVYDYLEQNVIGEKFADRGGQSEAGRAFRDARAQAADESPPRVNELQKLRDYERRIQTDVEGLKGEEKYQALRDTAVKIAELGAPIGQAGRADPKLLAAMGITGLGAAYGYWQNKDPFEAVRGALIGGGLVAAGVVLGKLTAANGRMFDGLKDMRYRITDRTDQYSAAVRLGELGSMRAEHALNALLPKVADRTQVLHAVQAGDLSGLSPIQLKYAETLTRGFEKGGELGQASGVLPEQLLKNYVTQLWVRGLNTKDSLIENLKNAMTAGAGLSPGMSPKSRFAKQRSIPNYKAGIDAGLVPVTLDPSAILRIYLNNVNRAVQNKKFLDVLGRETTPLGEPLLAKSNDLEAEVRRRLNHETESLPLDPAAKQMVAAISAIKSPNDYVFINHPQMMGVKVHADVAPPLKALFDASDTNAAMRAAYGVSVAAKRGLFSFSLFHAMALLHAQFGAPLVSWTKIPGALKALREGGNAGVDDLVAGGLNVVGKPLEADARAFSNAMRVLEAKMPMAALPIKGARWVQEHMDHFLWGVVQPSFKVASALAQYEKQLGKNPNMPKEQIAKNVASWANDLFGGLDWFKIADGVQTKYLRDLSLAITSPSGRRFMQIGMLAPDWTVATTRAMAKAIPGVSDTMIGNMHRGYVLRSALVYLTVAEGLNQAFSGHHIWENQDPTMVDLGDGRRLQLSKHFMEPVHWLTKPGQQLLNKLGYLPKEVMTQAQGVEYLKSGSSGPPMDTSLAGRLKHAAKGMLPIPASVAGEQGVGPAFSGMVGAPIYGKTQEQAIDAAVERALNLRAKRLESGTDQEKATARKKSETETAQAAKRRTEKAYDKRRQEQRARER